jgi:FMN hydrolase / 5-amino-6-(5-phospho-D-ribitylamino)uracil phosphatase
VTGEPIEAISLDLDDSLWPSVPTLLAAEQTLHEWLAAHAPRTASIYSPAFRQATRNRLLAGHPDRAHDVGWLRRASLRQACRDAGDDPGLADSAFEIFLAARQQVTLYPDVEPVLARWAGRYRLVAISNGNADIGRIGLGRYFSACVSAHEAGFGKPDRRIFHEACRRIAIAPAATLHIGDDWQLDVRAARDAGLQAAWLRRPGLARSQATAEEPDQDTMSFESLDAIDRHLLATR